MSFVTCYADAFARHLDTFATGCGVCHRDELFSRNARFLVESQQPPIRHRHVNRNNKVALGDYDCSQRVIIDDRYIFTEADFIAIHGGLPGARESDRRHLISVVRQGARWHGLVRSRAKMS